MAERLKSQTIIERGGGQRLRGQRELFPFGPMNGTLTDSVLLYAIFLFHELALLYKLEGNDESLQYDNPLFTQSILEEE